MFALVNAYCERNPGTNQDLPYSRSSRELRKITNNLVGVIELDGNLDIETVTEIFIREVELSRAGCGIPDSARQISPCRRSPVTKPTAETPCVKADYFCHLAVAPEFYGKIKENDTAFAATEFFQQMGWLRNENDGIYDPSYTDMLRVAFTRSSSAASWQTWWRCSRARNFFETKQFEESIAEQSFRAAEGRGDELHQRDTLQALRDDHPVGGLCGSVAHRFAERTQLCCISFISCYTNEAGKPAADIEAAVRRWFVMSMLTGRYSAFAGKHD